MSKNSLKDFFPKNVKGLTATSDEAPVDAPSPDAPTEPAVNKTSEATSGADSKTAKPVDPQPEATEQEPVVTDDESKVDVVEGEETTEGSEPWFADDELGIVYNSDEEARRGLVEKEKFIRKIMSERDEIRKEAEALRQQKELEASRQGREETFKQRVREKLPEEYRNLDPNTITDQEELVKYSEALTDAKAEIIAEDKVAEAQEKARKETKQKVRAQAKEHVTQKVDELISSAKNIEDRLALEEVLTDTIKVNGQDFNPMIMAMMAYEVHPSYADHFLQGLYNNYSDQKRQNVEKYIRNTRRDPAPTVPATPPVDKNVTPGPRLRGDDALKSQLKKKFRELGI